MTKYESVKKLERRWLSELYEESKNIYLLDSQLQ